MKERAGREASLLPCGNRGPSDHHRIHLDPRGGSTGSDVPGRPRAVGILLPLRVRHLGDGRAERKLFRTPRSHVHTLRAGAIPASPLFRQDGTSVRFDLTLPGSGQYHVVAVNLPGRQELQLHADVTAMGLKTGDAIVAVIVLVGGLALVAASLMLSVWAWRRGRSASPVPPQPSMDPAPDSPSDPPQDPVPDPPGDPQDPPDDNTRIY